MNDLKIEKKGFKEQITLIKEVTNSIKMNVNGLMYFAFFILCLFTLNDYLSLNVMLDQTKINVDNPYSIGSISAMFFEGFKTMVFLYILSIMCQAELFVNKLNSGKNILKSIFSIKLYLNILFLGFVILFAGLLFGHIGLPENLTSELIEHQNNPKAFEAIIQSYSNTLTSMDVFLIIFSIIGFLFCFGFFLFASYISYSNIRNHNLGIIKGNLKTYLGLLKNILYWIIPTIIYFVGLVTIINYIAPNDMDNTVVSNIFRNILLSIYLAVGGFYIHQIKLNIFPLIYNFDPEKEEKERIKKKYNKK